MARARNIKPGFFKNEDLAECSFAARLCFAGLWTLADREGRLEDRPKRIKGELFAFDSVEVEPLLAELETHRFLVRYRNSDGSFIQISKFSAHQTPHYSEKQSFIKPPEGYEAVTHKATQTPRGLQDDSGSDGGIKKGSQPPDSLNPDSLNPETNPQTPSGPVPESGGDQQPEPEKPKTAVTFKTWTAELKAKRDKVLPEDDPIFAYAEKVGLSRDYLHLAWLVFRKRYGEPGVTKRYKDWRRVFRTAIRENWGKLWWLDDQGNYALTTTGKQAKLEFGDE